MEGDVLELRWKLRWRVRSWRQEDLPSVWLTVSETYVIWVYEVLVRMYNGKRLRTFTWVEKMCIMSDVWKVWEKRVSWKNSDANGEVSSRKYRFESDTQLDFAALVSLDLHVFLRILIENYTKQLHVFLQNNIIPAKTNVIKTLGSNCLPRHHAQVLHKSYYKLVRLGILSYNSALKLSEIW